MAQRSPKRIWIVRHGESAGNVARDRAAAEGLTRIDIAERDVDVPLSDLGHEQAAALGAWFAAMPEGERPEVLLVSPYRRAVQTAAIIREAGALSGNAGKTLLDERLREKEFGILDRLTKLGIQEKFPEQAEMRSQLGKFYYRPPGGESWCDVILRLRSVIDTVTREYRRERVLIVSHQVVVNCFRYLFERMTEEQILTIDRQHEIANCSVTSYQFDSQAGAKGGKLAMRLFNFVAPLAEAGEEITTKPDVPAGPK